jgi:serine/threonine protein kinase
MGADPQFDAFLATVRRSRLFDPPELERLLTQARAGSARAFADALVRTHELTHYQADKLLRGRWQGLVVGPYSVLAPLGRGGMGTVVYLARDRRAAESLGDTELLALKLLSARKAQAEPRALARFRREMFLGRRANHPNVVRTLAAGEVEHAHYLALEFVPGKTLRRLVTQKGRLGVGDAARICADVAAGLEHLHRRGLIHRDLKPGNIIVRPDGRAVLLDLGLAFAPADPLPDDPAIVGGRGYIVGTMDYLAPEQARDSTRVGPAADLYGLGCTLFCALTGEPPFPATGNAQKIRRHRSDVPPGLPEVPAEFARLVHRLMAKDPAERPPSAAAVRTVLLRWATAAVPLSAVDPLAVADAPGLDSGLWDATPGDELSTPANESRSLVWLNPGSAAPGAEPGAGAAGGERSPGTNRAGWLLVGLLLSLMGVVMLVAVLRRL